MTRPSRELPYGMARKLDGGRGRVAEAVEAVKDHGAGALHLAAGNNKVEVCEYLVEDVRVDVDVVDICGRTPLVWAITCEDGYVDIVRYLLDHGANPDNVDKTGFTPLHEAAKKGNCQIVELLLSRGAYVDPFSTNRGTPLHVAAYHKQDGAMKILLGHHADCNKFLDCGSSPLILAIYSCSVKCVNILLEAGADVKGMRTTTPLVAAAANGLTDVLNPLLDAGADPNVRNEFGHLPIQLAAYFGTRKDVEILFGVTSSSIPALHDWSVDGIISYVKSEPKLEAILADPENADSTLIGNRGFCRFQLGNGKGALIDAQLCRKMRPDCAQSCWLQGYSYVQLQDYENACDAFLDGLKLKPGFAGIEKALREALRLLKESHADKKNGLEGQYREARFFL